MKRAPLFLSCALTLAAASLHAQSTGRGPTGQMLYPAKGQSVQQAERDKFECHEWAKQQSGFDPATAPVDPALRHAQGERTDGASASARAAMGGAVGGAAIAELADKDAGKGAAAGLLGAGLRQQMQQRQQLNAQQQQALQQQAVAANKRGTYDRGFAACMEARGYVVK